MTGLEYQRAEVRSIVDGMSEDDWHTSVVPSGWTPAGLVAHLGGAERHWTCDVILDHDPGHPFDDDFVDEPYDPLAPFVIDWPAAKVLTSYQDQSRQTDDMLATTALASKPLGRHGSDDTDQPASVREIVLHLIEETATHSGHLEIARELLDGKTRLGLRRGPSVDPSELAAPPNAIVVPGLPHRQILGRADAVVTHAGHGMVRSALTAGEPPVCPPLGRAQHDVSRVMAVGAGVAVDAVHDQVAVRDGVRVVLGYAAYSAQAADLARAIASYRGVPPTAETTFRPLACIACPSSSRTSASPSATSRRQSRSSPTSV